MTQFQTFQSRIIGTFGFYNACTGYGDMVFCGMCTYCSYGCVSVNMVCVLMICTVIYVLLPCEDDLLCDISTSRSIVEVANEKIV